MKVQRSDFLQWKKLAVTQEMFSILGEILKTVEENMLDSTLIRSDSGQLKLNELMGYRDAIKAVLEFEILDNDEEVSHDQKGESTWI